MKNMWLLLLGIIALVTWRCEEVVEPGDTPPDFAIALVEAPRAISARGAGDAPLYAVSFRVTHPEGLAAISEVRADFSAGGSTVFSLPLFDTGGLDPDHRDVVAGDGIFSNTFAGDSTVIPIGDVDLSGVVVDAGGDSRSAAAQTLTVLNNKAPRIVALSAPDTLYSGSAPLTLTLTVQDSNGVEDISTATLYLRRNGQEIINRPMTLESSSGNDTAVFGLSIDSSFAAGRSGDYTLAFEAKDASQTSSGFSERNITLENTAPRLFASNLPDSLMLPPTGFFDTLQVKISAADPQSLADLDAVSFAVYLEGGTPGASIEMFDNGNFDDHGDLTAGDGRYGRIIQLASTNTPGTYFFDYLALDKAGNASVVVQDTLVLVPFSGAPVNLGETVPLTGE